MNEIKEGMVLFGKIMLGIVGIFIVLGLLSVMFWLLMNLWRVLV